MTRSLGLVLVSVLLIACISTGTLAQVRDGGPKRLVPNNPADRKANAKAAAKAGLPQPNIQAPMVAMIEGFYIQNLQAGVDISVEQRYQIIPFLQDYLRKRAEIGGPRRNRAQNQLNQGLNRAAPDEELTAMTQEFDRIEVDLLANTQKLYSSVDPLLTAKQQARFRSYLVRMENRIRSMIEASQNPASVPPARPNAEKKP